VRQHIVWWNFEPCLTQSHVGYEKNMTKISDQFGYVQDSPFLFIFAMKSMLPDKFDKKEKINKRGLDALT